MPAAGPVLLTGVSLTSMKNRKYFFFPLHVTITLSKPNILAKVLIDILKIRSKIVNIDVKRSEDRMSSLSTFLDLNQIDRDQLFEAVHMDIRETIFKEICKKMKRDYRFFCQVKKVYFSMNFLDGRMHKSFFSKRR